MIASIGLSKCFCELELQKEESTMKNKKMLDLAVIAFLFSALACESGTNTDKENVPNSRTNIRSLVDANDHVAAPERKINIYSVGSANYLRSDFIPVRSEDLSMQKTELPAIEFAEYSDSSVESILVSKSELFFGENLGKVASKIEGKIVSLEAAPGVAWIGRNGGVFTLKRTNYSITTTSIENEEQAVRAAVGELAKSGLVDLHEYETLDIVEVKTAYRSGYREDADGTKPVVFGYEANGEPVYNVKTHYTVYFGRRYKGVPIIGPTLGVRLTSEGEIAALMKDWRDIKGENGNIKIVSEQVMEQRRKPEIASLPIISKKCGYIESSGLGWKQKVAGVGCEILLDNIHATDTLDKEVTDTINIAEDDSRSLFGERANAQNTK